MLINRFYVFLLVLMAVPLCLAVFPVSTSETYPKLKVLSAKEVCNQQNSAVPFQNINSSLAAADIFCPGDIEVDASPGECGAIVRFEDATAPDIPQAEEIIMLFEGAAEADSPYIENGMRLDGNGLSHIDAPWPISCNNRQGALIHPNTSNTWTYNGGQPFTPTRLFVCSTNMRFTTGDCGTEFIPETTGEVTFPDTPEWQNITSMVWEQWGDDFDASMDNFRFIPSAVQQTEGLESGCFFPVGTTPVTFSATDTDGTVSTCTFNVTVRDTEKPALIVKEFTTALDASQLAEITIEDITTSLPTDNCAIDTIVISRTIFTCSDVGSNEVTVQQIIPWRIKMKQPL